MSSSRFPSSRFPMPQPKKVEKEIKDVNALWRIPSWFPKLPVAVLEGLRTYQSELLKFNVRVNLISRTTEREADEVHFADCILASEILLKQKLSPRVYDIGSGNGFPGIIMALLDPSREFLLVEADSRKAEFLKHSVHLLLLKNVTVMNVRFESLAAQDIDCAFSRGFASISKTVLACNRIFKSGGSFYHLKGSSWSSEIADLPSQLISIWRPGLVGEYVLPVSQARRAIVSTHKN